MSQKFSPKQILARKRDAMAEKLRLLGQSPATRLCHWLTVELMDGTVRCMAKKGNSLVPMARIERAIFLIRGEKVLLDSDLASLYGVETKVLVPAVKRNINRCPDDFMFQLSNEAFKDLRSQIMTSS